MKKFCSPRLFYTPASLLVLLLLSTIAPTAFSQDVISHSKEKLDPFKPMDLSVEVDETIASELQKYALNDFIVSGILLGKNLSALVITPKNNGVIIKIGDNIGRNGGKVIGIFKDHILIRESIVATVYKGKTKQIRKSHQDISLYLIDKAPGKNANTNKDILALNGEQKRDIPRIPVPTEGAPISVTPMAPPPSPPSPPPPPPAPATQQTLTTPLQAPTPVTSL